MVDNICTHGEKDGCFSCELEEELVTMTAERDQLQAECKSLESFMYDVAAEAGCLPSYACPADDNGHILWVIAETKADLARHRAALGEIYNKLSIHRALIGGYDAGYFIGQLFDTEGNYIFPPIDNKVKSDESD